MTQNESDLSTARASLTEAISNSKSLQESNSELAQSLAELKLSSPNLSNIEVELAEKSQELASVRSSLSEAQAKLQDLEQKLNESQTKHETNLELTVSEYKAKLEELRNGNEELLSTKLNEIDSLREQLTQMGSQNQVMRRQTFLKKIN